MAKLRNVIKHDVTIITYIITQITGSLTKSHFLTGYQPQAINMTTLSKCFYTPTSRTNTKCMG